MTYCISDNPSKHKEWIKKEASIRMLVEELEKPELVNEEQISFLVEKGLSDNTILLVEKDGVPVGIIGALLVANVYNPDLNNLVEMFWYVLPEYRNTRAPAMLLKAYDELAQALNVHSATFSLFLTSSTIKIESMEKRGFMLEEFGFRKGY